MIEINSIEDLKPYVKYVPSKYFNGNYSYMMIEIVEDGKLSDVTINCGLDLSFSLDNVYNNVFGVEEAIANDTMSEWCEIQLYANNIYVKKEIFCNYIECENLYFEDNVSANFLVVNNEIWGDRAIFASDIRCHTLRADFVSSKMVNAINFKANKFYNSDTLFVNFSFCQPDFPKEITRKWQGVKVHRYEFEKADLKIPF